MAKAYKLARAADADLNGILEFTLENWGEAKTKAYATGLDDAFAFIAENPEAARVRPELVQDVRSHLFQSHRIYYRIGSTGTVEILRILHYARDAEAIFLNLR